MASEKGNGHDPITAQMVDLLGKITGLREDVRDVHAELAAFKTETRNELSGIRVEVRADLHEIREGLDEIRKDLRTELRERLAKVEATIARIDPAVLRPTG